MNLPNKFFHYFLIFAFLCAPAYSGETHPGGTTGQIQYNNGGYFGGLAIPLAVNKGGTGTTSGSSGPYLSLTGGTLSGGLNLGGNAITNASAVNGFLATGNISQFTNDSGYITSAGAPVQSVANSDGTLTISPTTGSVVASLALGHANTWTSQQTFNTSAPIFGTMTQGSILFTGSGGLLSQDNTKFFWDDTTIRLGINVAAPAAALDVKGQTAAALSGATATTTMNIVGGPGGTGTTGVNGGIGSAVNITSGAGGAGKPPAPATNGGQAGNITLTGGIGGAGTIAVGGKGGSIALVSGVGGGGSAPGGASGDITITIANGGTGSATGGAAGAFTVNGGIGGGGSAAGASSNISLISGAGLTGTNPGSGGTFTMTSGIGGQSPANAGGLGGAFNILSGNGGASNSTGSNGGAAGLFTLGGGVGGVASGGLGGNGGAGGSFILAGGAGGASTHFVGGIGGNMFVNPGLGGTGVTAGAPGYVGIATDPTAFTLTGNTSIGGQNPTAYFHIMTGGTTTVPPFKLTAGTNLSSIQAGAIEYDGTHLYFTNGVPTRFQLDQQGTVTSVGTGTGLSGGTITTTGTVSSNAVYQVGFQPGLLTSVTSTKSVFGKVSKASTVDNIEGSALLFTCVSNPTITMYECGTSSTCATPTTIGSVTVTASGQVFDGTVSSASITAGDYIAWAISAGTCTSLDIAATAQVHSN